MEALVLTETNGIDLSKFSLFIACVGVGNVSQMACDLLILNFNCKRVGILDTDCVIAVVGNDPYSEDLNEVPNLSTSVELYMNADKNVAILQFLASPLRSHFRSLISELVDLLAALNPKTITLLSSSFAMIRLHNEDYITPFRYAVGRDLPHSTIDELLGLKWPLLAQNQHDQELAAAAAIRRRGRNGATTGLCENQTLALFEEKKNPEEEIEATFTMTHAGGSSVDNNLHDQKDHHTCDVEKKNANAKGPRGPDQERGTHDRLHRWWPRPEYRLPGSGIATNLFSALQARRLPVCLLNVFTSHGDNREKAVMMLERIVAWLKLTPTEGTENKQALPDINKLETQSGRLYKALPGSFWRTPASWKMFYGSEINSCMY